MSWKSCFTPEIFKNYCKKKYQKVMAFDVEYIFDHEIQPANRYENIFRIFFA